MTLATRWVRDNPEFLRHLAEETALGEATELVSECIENREITRSDLAARLGVGRSEVTQRLSGKRNLSVKTLGAMLHELGYRLVLDVEDLTAQRPVPRSFHVTDTAWGATRPRYTTTGASLRVVRPSA